MELNKETIKKILDDIDLSAGPPEEEPARQYYFMASARRRLREQFAADIASGIFPGQLVISGERAAVDRAAASLAAGVRMQTVEAVGSGATRTEAINAALTEAVSKVNGLSISAKDQSAIAAASETRAEDDVSHTKSATLEAASREVQTATLAIPNTGMAVAIDIGDPFDIHPSDKQTLAYRMAREAERIAYGSKTVSAGPLYKSMEIKDGKVYLSFDNVGSGLVANGGELASFAIAGKDGKFVWAKAKIDGDEVVVWSDAVKEPVAVRYAWSSYPGNANLYNKEGFPASPFRTDQPDYLLKK